MSPQEESRKLYKIEGPQTPAVVLLVSLASITASATSTPIVKSHLRVVVLKQLLGMGTTNSTPLNPGSAGVATSTCVDPVHVALGQPKKTRVVEAGASMPP